MNGLIIGMDLCDSCTHISCQGQETIWSVPTRIGKEPDSDVWRVAEESAGGALDSHSSQALLSTIQSINESLDATILMVTHDAFSASYANRILFLRDGAIFAEILKGSDSRRVFFEKILDVLTMMGGGVNDVH